MSASIGGYYFPFQLATASFIGKYPRQELSLSLANTLSHRIRAKDSTYAITPTHLHSARPLTSPCPRMSSLNSPVHSSASPLPHSQAISVAQRDPMDAAAAQEAPQSDPLPDDPTQRSTGFKSTIANDVWKPSTRRSLVHALLEKHRPGILEFHEQRKTGKIEEMPFLETEEPVDMMAARKSWRGEHGKVESVFFPVDYNCGFSHRGRELAFF